MILGLLVHHLMIRRRLFFGQYVCFFMHNNYGIQCYYNSYIISIFKTSVLCLNMLLNCPATILFILYIFNYSIIFLFLSTLKDYVATRWYRAPELCGSFSSKVSTSLVHAAYECMSSDCLQLFTLRLLLCKIMPLVL